MGNIFSQIEDQYIDPITNVGRTSAGNSSGFSDLATIPQASGMNVRQAQIPNERTGIAKRNLVRWFLPETGIIEMYINPQSIKYTDKKHIPTPTRTRGGYNIQYWGEELGNLSIRGTTGSSGVEGINVLYDIYRNEQIVFDVLAQAAEAAREENTSTGGLLENIIGGESVLGSIGSAIGVGVSDSVLNILEAGSTNPTAQRMTLASLAFQTEMYWSGWVFRGFFTQMSVDESADKLGLFDYDISFTVTQKRGMRLNFMPWHRSAVNGPSNSDPAFGTPYSFGTLRTKSPSVSPATNTISQIKNIDKLLQSYRPL
jgi:hypothetical protein